MSSNSEFPNRYSRQLGRFAHIGYYEYSRETRIIRHRQRLVHNLSTTGTNEHISLLLHRHFQKRPFDHRYADYNDEEVRACLQDLTSLPADHLTLTAGAEDALRLLANVLFGQQIRVGIVLPTFLRILLYPQIFPPGSVHYLGTEDEGYQPNAGQLKSFISKHDIDVLILTNPNTPTGKVLASSILADLAASVPDTLLVVDMSLFNFCLDAAELFPLVRRPNVVCCFSFSKVFGVPGIRLGFVAASNPALTGAIRRVVSPHAISTAALEAGAFLLRDPAIRCAVTDARALIHKNFAYLKSIEGNGLRVVGDPTYSCLIKSELSESLFEFLLSEGVLTVDASRFDGISHPNVIRVLLDRFPLEQLSPVFSHYAAGSRQLVAPTSGL